MEHPKLHLVSRLDENIVLYNVFHRLNDAKPVDAAWGAPGCGDPLYSADRNTAGYPEGWCPAALKNHPFIKPGRLGNPMKNPMKSPEMEVFLWENMGISSMHGGCKLDFLLPCLISGGYVWFTLCWNAFLITCCRSLWRPWPYLDIHCCSQLRMYCRSTELMGYIWVL